MLQVRGIYLAIVFTKVSQIGGEVQTLTLPDIDPTLVILMTFSQGEETYYFHELYRDNGEYGCNPTMRPEICVPECRFYGETGRFEDDELVEEHKKAVELFNKHNAIIEIEIGDDDSFRIKQVRKYSQMKIIIIIHS